MTYLLRRTLISALITLLPLQAAVSVAQQPGASQRPGVVISTGVEGGGYWSAGERLQKVAAELGLPVEVIASSGSRENVARLMDPASPVGLAFAQADVIQHYVQNNPDAGKYAEILENVGEECVFILTAIDSDLDTLDDLADEAENVTVHIDSETSGPAATLEMMGSLMPDLQQASVRYGDTAPVMQQLLANEESTDAVMVVHKPRAHSPAVAAAIAHPDQIQFVDMEKAELDAKLMNGDDVFRHLRLQLPGAKKPVSTVCVKGYLLASRSKVQVEQFKQLTDLVRFQWMRVYATPDE